MNILRLTLLILLAISYLFSGYAKLIPIEYFENDILRSELANEISVLFISRFIVGSEFVIGVLLLFRLFLKQTLKVSLWMLLLYTVYLLYVIIRFGNEGNCGCYGQQFVLSPLHGIIKNIFIGVVTIYLFRSINYQPMTRWPKAIAVTLGVLVLLSPFVIYKIDFPEKLVIDGQEKEKLNLDLLYSNSDVEAPQFELRHGKTIVAFLSLKCYKCKMAANKLELIKRQHPDLPIYFIINGEQEDFEEFKKMSELRDVPYSYFNDGDELIKICGVVFPAVFLSNNSYLDADLNYTEITADNLLQWINN
jgi:hypothetical protein